MRQQQAAEMPIGEMFVPKQHSFDSFDSFIVWMLPTRKTLFWCHIMSQGHPAGREDEELTYTEVSEDKGEDHRSGHAVQQNRS